MKFRSFVLAGLLSLSYVGNPVLSPSPVQAQSTAKVSMPDFFKILAGTDLIGCSQADVEKQLGAGAPCDTKGGEGKPVCMTYSVSDPAITAIEIEYQDGKVSQWRLAGHALEANSNLPLSAAPIKRSAWMTTNMVQYVVPNQPNLIAVQDKKDAKQEPVLLALLSPQPSAREFLEAAKAARIGFFLKQADELAKQSSSKAISADDTRDSTFFVTHRLPLHLSSWVVEHRHAEGYAKESKNPAEAQKMYEQNIAEDPNFEFSYYTLAKLKEISGDYDGAAKNLESVLKLNPGYQRAMFELAKVQLLQGNGTKAIETAKKAYALYPDDLEAKNQLNMVQQLGVVVDKKATDQFNKVPKKFYIISHGQKRVWTKLAPFLWIEEQPDGLRLTYWAMGRSSETGFGRITSAPKMGTIMRREDGNTDAIVPDPGGDPGLGYRYPGKTGWGVWEDMHLDK